MFQQRTFIQLVTRFGHVIYRSDNSPLAGGECYDGDAGVVSVHGEISEQLLHEFQLVPEAFLFHASRAVHQEHQVHFLVGRVTELRDVAFQDLPQVIHLAGAAVDPSDTLEVIDPVQEIPEEGAVTFVVLVDRTIHFLEHVLRPGSYVFRGGGCD